MSQGKEVNEPCSAWLEMHEAWDLCEVLRGGTRAVRQRSFDLLPRRQAESWRAYQSRVGQSILYQAYHDTVTKVASRPFRKPVALKNADILHEQIERIETDADYEGQSLTGFANDALDVAVHRGLVHAIVDYPRYVGSDGKTQQINLAQEREFGFHPYFVLVDPIRLIGWRYVTVFGRKTLTQVRIRHVREEEDSVFGIKPVKYVKVWYQSHWEEWRQVDNTEEFALAEEGPHTFVGGVPIETFYVNKKRFMVGEPALEDLAWLNLRHYQSMSQQTTILDVVRSAILVRSGFSSKELDKPIVVGAHNAYGSENPDATMKWVEHSGQGTDAGFKDLSTLEDRMETLGNQPFTKQSSKSTALGKEIDEDRTTSEIQSWLRDEETWLGDLYKAAHDWVGAPVPKEFVVDIFNDFSIGQESTPQLTFLEKINARGLLTNEQLLREAKRRGVLSADVDVEKELKLAALQAPTLPEPGEDEIEEEDEEEDEVPEEETADA